MAEYGEIYTPPPANPAGGGLYNAAAVLDNVERIGFGVLVDSINCGTSWVWPLNCEADVPDPNPMGTSRAALDDPFTGDAVAADDNCGAAVPEAEARERAMQLLRLQESVRTEQQLAPKLLAAAGTPTNVTGLVAAVGALEEAVAGSGFTGVFHAAPHLAAALTNAQLVIRQGQQLLTPMGHRWAFGAGYAGLGETIVSTGPVTVHRGPIGFAQGPDYQHNDRLSVAMREVLVTWECWAEAVTIGA